VAGCGDPQRGCERMEKKLRRVAGRRAPRGKADITAGVRIGGARVETPVSKFPLPASSVTVQRRMPRFCLFWRPQAGAWGYFYDRVHGGMQ
jgi:hypothetical protein